MAQGWAEHQSASGVKLCCTLLVFLVLLLSPYSIFILLFLFNYLLLWFYFV